MNSSFDFDFDDAEDSIKKIKEKEAKEQQEKANTWSATIPWYSVPTRITVTAEFDNHIVGNLEPIEFGKVKYPHTTTKIRQNCDCCKNNAQKYINTCRKCKIYDRRNKQSNFVLDESIELGPPIPKMNHIWQQTFAE